jgi:hypothetical protein
MTRAPLSRLTNAAATSEGGSERAAEWLDEMRPDQIGGLTEPPAKMQGNLSQCPPAATDRGVTIPWPAAQENYEQNDTTLPQP